MPKARTLARKALTALTGSERERRLSSHLDAAGKQLALLEAQSQSLQSRLKAQGERIETLNAAKQKATADNTQLKGDLRRTGREQARLENQLGSTRRQGEELLEQCQQLKQLNQDMRDVHRELKGELGARARAASRAEAALERSQARVGELSGEVERLRGELGTHARGASRADAALERSQAQVGELSGNVEKLKDELDALRREQARQATFESRITPEMHAQNRATIENLHQTVKQLRVESSSQRTQKTLERIDTFLGGTSLTLPPGPFRRFVERCREESPERADAFLAALEADGHRALFEQLFFPEMAMAQGFNFRELESVITFQRGEHDIARAERNAVSLDNLKANHIRISDERFGALVTDAMIAPDAVNAVCEIGAAWGAATRHFIDRYSPETFHVYEIDTAWAQWLADNLGVDSKNCDGETLGFTDDATMDICVASSCLYFMPWIKQWKYLSEFARVLRPGGLAVFNVNLVERLGLRNLDGLLTNYFPRREFGYLPEHCLNTALPEDRFERLVAGGVDNEYYYVLRKRG